MIRLNLEEMEDCKMAERKTKKAAAPKPVCTEAIYLQFGGKEISTDEIRRTGMEKYTAFLLQGGNQCNSNEIQTMRCGSCSA